MLQPRRPTFGGQVLNLPRDNVVEEGVDREVAAECVLLCGTKGRLGDAAPLGVCLRA